MNTVPQKHKAAQQSPPDKPCGRMLIPDSCGPVELFPLRLGGPLRFREATHREVWLWEAKVDVQLRGGLWTDELRAQFEVHYEREMTALIRETSFQENSSQEKTHA